jgi:replicative DNA helicase
MKIVKKQIEKYHDKRASCQVLGSLMSNVFLIKDKKYALNIEDFPNGLHQLLFTCIYNLSLQGLAEIKVSDIEGYLNNNDPKAYILMFENEKNREWLFQVYESANVSNYEYYYNKLRKLSLLRQYIHEGIDVSEILDMEEIDHIIIKQQQENFEKMSLGEIQQYYDRKNFNIKEKFLIKDSTKRRKAGDNAKELKEKIKESPCYGFGLESQYLNTLTRGALKGSFFLETRDSGKGKSRCAIERLLLICCPYLWDYNKNDFVPNPNGKNNVGLYIGTEMQLYEELEPMMWAFVSGVEEYKIKKNTLSKEEDKRIDKAIGFLEQTKLFLEDEADYDLAYIWNTIDRYKTKEGLNVVAIDYLELTVGLTAEYVQLTRGMTAREDQVLLNLSKSIKNLATDYGLSIFGFTQTTDDARKEGVRDQRAVKGARSLPNKADVGIVVFTPTKKELELIQPLIQKGRGLNGTITPNTCYTVYKNRFGEITDEVKIWCYQNLGNMKTIDLFCTNKDYEPISIDKTIINLLEEDD